MKKKKPKKPDEQPDMGKIYQIKDLVKMFEVAPTTVRRWFDLEHDPLKRFKVGKVVRIYEYDLKRFRDIHRM